MEFVLGGRAGQHGGCERGCTEQVAHSHVVVMQLVADQGTALQCLETVGVHQQHGLTVDTRLRVLPQLQPRLPSHTLVGIAGSRQKVERKVLL